MSDTRLQIHAIHVYKTEVADGVFVDDTIIIDVAETDTIGTLLDRLSARRKWGARQYGAELQLLANVVSDDDGKAVTK